MRMQCIPSRSLQGNTLGLTLVLIHPRTMIVKGRSGELSEVDEKEKFLRSSTANQD